MFNPDLVEYESNDVDGWDDRGHYTSTISYYPLIGPLHDTLMSAAEDCLLYVPNASRDIWWGILTTHLIELEHQMECRYHQAPEVDDLDLFTSITECGDPIDMRCEFTTWLEDEFPEREEDDDDCGD